MINNENVISNHILLQIDWGKRKVFQNNLYIIKYTIYIILNIPVIPNNVRLRGNLE